MAQFRSLADLANTTQDQLLPGIINGLINKDEFSSVLVGNAAITDRPTVKFNRLLDKGTASYVGPDDTIVPQAISGAPVSYDLQTISTSFDVSIVGQNLYSSFTDAVSSELDGALERISELINSDAIVGNGVSKLTGLESQIVYSVAQATAGAGNFDLTDLDNLMDLVRTAGPKVMVGAPATVNKVISELRSNAGGTDSMQVQGTAFVRPAFYDVPLLKSQYVTAGELHLIDLNEFKLFIGESEDANIGGIFSMIGVGPLESKLRKRWHLYCQAASVLINDRGAASLTGIA